MVIADIARQLIRPVCVMALLGRLAELARMNGHVILVTRVYDIWISGLSPFRKVLVDVVLQQYLCAACFKISLGLQGPRRQREHD